MYSPGSICSATSQTTSHAFDNSTMDHPKQQAKIPSRFKLRQDSPKADLPAGASQPSREGPSQDFSHNSLGPGQKDPATNENPPVKPQISLDLLLQGGKLPGLTHTTVPFTDGTRFALPRPWPYAKRHDDPQLLVLVDEASRKCSVDNLPPRFQDPALLCPPTPKMCGNKKKVRVSTDDKAGKRQVWK